MPLMWGQAGASQMAAARRNAERSAADALGDLEDATVRLALPHAEIPDTRVALHAYHTQRSDLAGSAFLIACLDFVLLLPPFVFAAASGTTSMQVDGKDSDPVFVNVYLAIAALTLPWVPIVWFLRRTRAGGVAVRHRLTVRTARAAVLCADIHEQPAAARSSRLRRLDRQCHQIERDLLRAHRTARTMALTSPRHASARQHAAHVAGALRRDLVRLDGEPDAALRDIARKLITIGERYAQGRVGALLPDDALRDAVPLSITRETLKESLRLVVAILTSLAAALTVYTLLSHLGVPGFLRSWCSLVAALVPGLLIAGPQRVLPYLSIRP